MMGADANRATVDPSSFEDIMKKGEEINQNAGSSELGENISNTPGTCEEVKVGEKRDYYDATCDVGVTVTTPDRVEELSCPDRSEEHTSELQSLMRISYAAFCLTKTEHPTHTIRTHHHRTPKT